MAAARGLHEGAVDVAVPLEEVVARRLEVFHGMQPIRLVEAAHLPLLEIVEELGEDELDFADADGVAVPERFLRHEARMHAPHGHRYPARPEGVGDLVAAVHVARHGGDAHEVRLEVEVDGFDVLVGEHHFVAVAGNSRGHREEAGER